MTKTVLRSRLLPVFIAVIVVGFLLPDARVIPVKGATNKDWNARTFWYEPWGTSGVHKGIDIFGHQGDKVVSAAMGLVVFSGELAKGGKVIAVLGPKWRIHYYAHLDSNDVTLFDWVEGQTAIGTVGTSGNAAGKQPHLHYSILSLLPYPWKMTAETQGWKKMFYLDPIGYLNAPD